MQSMGIVIGPLQFQEQELAEGLPEQEGLEDQGNKLVTELTRSSIFIRSSESFGAKF